MAEQVFYRIVKAELTQFATLTDSFNPEKKIMQNNEMSISFDPFSSILGCTFSVILRDEDNEPLMKASMLCGFEIKKESVEAISRDEKVTFPTSVLTHLASLTYSSLRGAISVKAEDTPLRGFVLPFCNVGEHIKKAASFKLTD